MPGSNKSESAVTWFGLSDGEKIGRYRADDEPGVSFLVAIAVPGLNNHRRATVSVNGIEIGSRDNVQCAMRYAVWFLKHRRGTRLNRCERS